MAPPSVAVSSCANNTEVEIVGVLADALWEGRRNRRPDHHELILSLDQFPHHSVGIVFATSVAPNSLIDTVRRTIVARDGSAALHWITTMEEALDAQTVNERFWTVLATAYAGTAFLLAVIGLYGVLSHNVASRRQEMGDQARCRRDRRGARATRHRPGLAAGFLGVVAGLGVALLVGRLLESPPLRHHARAIRSR